ncbi:putative N-acetyltransferase [Clostridium bornimense]|uniref:Putative N-acetyltransferase n=1 Tax=Clostridium bornimense TaxID=1216932 RepID=W6S0X7_9CLOT|nr:GNAT family N-acetyltransferase [Clostridium bornimense]CDM67927.1 putative N-acetyltransferase [Clostridium bornimense]
MRIIHTDGKDKRFENLCCELDKYLNNIIGEEKQQDQYNRYNTLEDIHDVILITDKSDVLACGGFKRYDEFTAEVKRVYVKENARRHGLGKTVMDEIEKVALKKGYKNLILETGRALKGAQKMYRKLGFEVINNFGQYIGNDESICMKKII